MMSWWSKTYNRPLKDPLLQSYTLEELIYEFYDRMERTNAEEEAHEEEGDRIEKERWNVAERWADEAEAEDKARDQHKKNKDEKPKDPRLDPENIKWMEEQIKADKEKYGEDFGEDVSVKFE